MRFALVGCESKREALTHSLQDVCKALQRVHPFEDRPGVGTTHVHCIASAAREANRLRSALGEGTLFLRREPPVSLDGVGDVTLTTDRCGRKMESGLLQSQYEGHTAA